MPLHCDGDGLGLDGGGFGVARLADAFPQGLEKPVAPRGGLQLCQQLLAETIAIEDEVGIFLGVRHTSDPV